MDKTCFVIMPISTPENSLSDYKNDRDHFLHVLEYLFMPAVNNAGFRLVKPIMKGAEIIQAEIIQNLERSDLVLCDISCLNPNVFFELGIRTALNKPVAYIKDNALKKIPFDTTIINHHTYDSDISPWKLKQEIPKLEKHVRNSYSTESKSNSLWKYFSLSLNAEFNKRDKKSNPNEELLLLEMKALKKEIAKISLNYDENNSQEAYRLIEIIRKIIINGGGTPIKAKRNSDGSILIIYRGNLQLYAESKLDVIKKETTRELMIIKQ